MCYQNREVEILNDHNDRDLNDRISQFFYPMQLVTPSVVAIAVSMLMAICRIVFQVFAFIFLVFLKSATYRV